MADCRMSITWFKVIANDVRVKLLFHLANLFARTDKKVETVPTCSQQTFSQASFNQSQCRILVFASRRANKVAKWKTGFRLLYSLYWINLTKICSDCLTLTRQ